MKKAPSYIYSIIGISLVLFLLGTIGWLAINGRSLSRYFKEQIELQVILHDNTRDEKTKELELNVAETALCKQSSCGNQRRCRQTNDTGDG